MWKCPKCERQFKKANQYHFCVVKDAGELFLNKPDELVLASDRLMNIVLDWEPCTMGVSVHSIVFTSKKAWLIVKPISKELDVKYYLEDRLEHDLIKKSTKYGNKWALHSRIAQEDGITNELIELIRRPFLDSLK